MTLNAQGKEAVKLMLRILSNDIYKLDDVPEHQKYLFKHTQNLKDAAVEFLADKIAKS